MTERPFVRLTPLLVPFCINNHNKPLDKMFVRLSNNNERRFCLEWTFPNSNAVANKVAAIEYFLR